jgi:hypothetical protein
MRYCLVLFISVTFLFCGRYLGRTPGTSDHFRECPPEGEVLYIEDRNICFDRIFFLDSSYYRQYYRSYFKDSLDTVPGVTRIVLFKLDNNIPSGLVRDILGDFPGRCILGRAAYRILAQGEGRDFVCHGREGYLILGAPLAAPEDELLVYYERSDGSKSSDIKRMSGAGGPLFYLDKGDTLYPFVLRPRNPAPSQPTWDLSWKNVYDIGYPDRRPLCFQVQARDSADPSLFRPFAQINGVETYLTDFFGLSDRGVLKTDDTCIFAFKYGLLIFPKSNGPEPFSNPKSPLPRDGKARYRMALAANR